MNPADDSCGQAEAPDVEVMELELRELRSRLELERLEREQLLASTSWRITAPLRRLKEFLTSHHSRAPSRLLPETDVPKLPAQLAHMPLPGSTSTNETFRLVDESRATYALRRAPHAGAGLGRIGFIGSRGLAEDLAPDAELEVLREEGWSNQLSERRVDYVLLETCWASVHGDWRYAMVREAGRQRAISDLLGYCKDNNVPCVLWFREDLGNYDRFSWLIPLVDRVYAIDEAVRVRICADQPPCPVGLLSPAVQPAVHNPVRSYPLQEAREQLQGLVLFDGWWELVGNEDLRSFARELAPEGLRVCESRWEFGAVRLDDMRDIAPYVLGCVDGRGKAALNKVIGVELFSPARFIAPWNQREKMLRALASGAAVGAVGWPEGDAETLSSAWRGEVSGVSGWLRELRSNTLAVAREAHLARRRVLQGHCMSHRLRAIANDLGLRGGEEISLPKVSVILVTMRPELLQDCLERFRRDLYPEKELIIVLHGKHDVSGARRLLRPNESAKVIQMGRERSLGACLNFAIELSEGEYWAKVDDDDLYGPYYLTDLMLQRQVIDFDLAGKPPAFAYLERTGALYHDPVWDGHAHLWHAPDEAAAALVAGGTLTGKRDLLADVRFCEKRRGGSDSDFVRRCYESGRGVLAADGFNFVRFRSSASGFHTWQMDEDDLLQRGSRVGSLQDVSAQVFI